MRVSAIAALLSAWLMLSCTANRMYRPDSLEQRPEYSLAFIELDDQGELWAPSQLDRALDQIDRLNRNHSGVAVAVFVHGWNTDASPREERADKGTIFKYRAMLSRLAQGLRAEFPGVEIPVMGIYLSWRGRVTNVPLLREASFFNRRGAAERISGATATEAIYRILTTVRENPASRSVVFGHSFGSMILERALAQAVVSALIDAPNEQLTFPADLVVLLNPASSAIQSKQLIDILARNRLKTYRFDDQGHRFERPLLVSFTSVSDRATRVYFPLGMSVKAINKKFRDYGEEYCSPIASQRRLYTHTAGHVSELFSHEITVGPKRPPNQVETPSGRRIPGFLNYEERYDPETQQVVVSFDGESHRFTIKRKPRVLNDTPYWIMQVPQELIPDHSTILTEDTFRLVESILVLTATFDAEATTTVHREDGVRPVAIVPRPDGSALFVDRSRGVYAVRPDSTRPVFLACLGESLDPGNAIGFHVAGHLAYAVLMTRRGDPLEPRCDTDLAEFEVDNAGYRQLSRIRFEGSECYTTATVDLVAKRALLTLDSASGPQLWAADLNERHPKPRLWLDLPGGKAPTSLFFEASRRRLFAAQVETGKLWQIEADTDEPVATLIDYDLGWPMALAWDRIDQRLYVTDAREHKIWALSCDDGCGNPTAFLDSAALEHPSTLAVGLDGTIWWGDLTSQTLMTIAPDGSVLGTIHTLRGAQ